jgi:hypothetical protein
MARANKILWPFCILLQMKIIKVTSKWVTIILLLFHIPSSRLPLTSSTNPLHIYCAMGRIRITNWLQHNPSCQWTGPWLLFSEKPPSLFLSWQLRTATDVVRWWVRTNLSTQSNSFIWSEEILKFRFVVTSSHSHNDDTIW